MKSRSGHRKVLKEAGMLQVKEIPVGENFQEHDVVPFCILFKKWLAFDFSVYLNSSSFKLIQNLSLSHYQFTSSNLIHVGGNYFY